MLAYARYRFLPVCLVHIRRKVHWFRVTIRFAWSRHNVAQTKIIPGEKIVHDIVIPAAKSFCERRISLAVFPVRVKAPPRIVGVSATSFYRESRARSLSASPAGEYPEQSEGASRGELASLGDSSFTMESASGPGFWAAHHKTHASVSTPHPTKSFTISSASGPVFVCP